MILVEHAKYHEMGPKDVGLKEPVFVQVARTTDHTGEQFAFNIPIYPDDSREQVKDRVNFFLSVMHDRVEDINKAIVELDEKNKKSQQIKELIGRNNQTFVNKAKALEKRFKKKQIKPEDYEVELKVLKDGLAAANGPLQKELEDAGEKFLAQMPEATQAEELKVVTEE
jgi:hypothetical protein